MIRVYGVDAEVIAPFRAPMELRITEGAWKKILSDVVASFPIEACGVLLGRVEGRTALVEEARRLRNILASNRAFWFDVTEWMSAIFEGREKGLEYIGVYHSHPREDPILSLSDRQRMLECPGEVWLVIGYLPGREPRAAAWVIRGYGLGVDRVRVTIERI